MQNNLANRIVYAKYYKLDEVDWLSQMLYIKLNTILSIEFLENFKNEISYEFLFKYTKINNKDILIKAIENYFSILNTLNENKLLNIRNAILIETYKVKKPDLYKKLLYKQNTNYLDKNDILKKIKKALKTLLFYHQPIYIENKNVIDIIIDQFYLDKIERLKNAK